MAAKNWHEQGEKTEVPDQGLAQDTPASSDNPDPPVKPETWPSWRKWTYIVLVAYCDCLTLVFRSNRVALQGVSG